jgi:methylase of polypeptide subunit release factors
MAQARDSSDAPGVGDREGIALLRATLLDAGFTPEGVRDALATEIATSRDAAELPLYLHLLRGGGQLATLIKLFVIDVEVPAAEAAAALARVGLERLEAMGVLVRAGDAVRATIEIVPTDGGLYVASDPFREELASPDHVLGVSPPARVLAWLTVRRPVERALDLGTGNGHQALLLAEHAASVTGTDINPRALLLAAFNAELNETGTIDLREGNLFEPVSGERFDLIVSNPPYVVSPENEIAYRDGGLRGDAFCELIVRELPGHLADGGFGEVLVSWLHALDADWTEPVRGWVEGSGCDALLIRYAVDEPADYAAGWNRPLRETPERYAAAIERWTAYFGELGVEAISWGALILRRREGANWFVAYNSVSDRIGASSEQVLRLFEAQDYVAETGSDGLLAGAFSLASDHRIEQTIRLIDGHEAVQRNVLRFDGGLRFEVSIDTATERVLALLDGRRPLGELLAQVAEEIDAPPEAFAERALPVLRRLIELGFVLPD